jgi:hypothetical protein
MRRLVGILALTLACSASSSPSPRPPEPTEAEIVAGIRRALEQWSDEDLASTDCSLFLSACTDRLVRKAGLPPEGNLANPRDLLENPDPEWLVGWDQAPTRPEESFTVLRALTYARSMRVHFDRCRSRHDERMRALAEVDDTVTRDVAALTGAMNSYERLAGLLRTRAAIKLRTDDLAGPRYRLELLIADAFRAAGKKRVYDFQNQRDEQAPLLRPLLAREQELMVTCRDDLPSWQDPEAVPARVVRQPFDRETRAALEQSIQGARDLESRIEVEPVDVPSYDAPTTTRTEGPLSVLGRQAFGAALQIVRVEKVPAGFAEGLSLVLEGRVTVKDAPFDCKEVERPSKDGEPAATTKDLECKRRTERRQVRFTLNVAEAPSAGIAPEDEIIAWVYPRRFERVERPLPDGSVDVTLTAEGDAFHILEIWRRGIVVAEYFN